MRYVIAIITATFLASVVGPALAQDDQPDARYQLEKTDDGYVRMDKQTGTMAICRQKSGQLVCKVAADERAAYNDQMDALYSRVEKLEKRVAALEETAQGDTGTATRPDDEFDRSMTVIKRVFQHFVDIVKDLNDELRRDGPANPQPGKT